jgi:hypothetical protein
MQLLAKLNNASRNLPLSFPLWSIAAQSGPRVVQHTRFKNLEQVSLPPLRKLENTMRESSGLEIVKLFKQTLV